MSVAKQRFIDRLDEAGSVPKTTTKLFPKNLPPPPPPPSGPQTGVLPVPQAGLAGLQTETTSPPPPPGPQKETSSSAPPPPPGPQKETSFLNKKFGLKTTPLPLEREISSETGFSYDPETEARQDLPPPGPQKESSSSVLPPPPGPQKESSSSEPPPPSGLPASTTLEPETPDPSGSISSPGIVEQPAKIEPISKKDTNNLVKTSYKWLTQLFPKIKIPEVFRDGTEEPSREEFEENEREGEGEDEGEDEGEGEGEEEPEEEPEEKMVKEGIESDIKIISKDKKLADISIQTFTEELAGVIPPSIPINKNIF